MNQSLAPFSPAASLRQTCLRMWQDRDTRSVIVGLAGMLLVHLLLYILAPHLLRSDSGAHVIRPDASAQQFDIEMAADEFKKPPETPPMNFVEANPNAPDNVPDKTNNFAAQNQQVAQEKPTEEGKSDRPALEGQTEIQSSQIVSGQLNQPMESAPPEPPAEEQPAKASEAPPKLEQIPLAGFEKTEGQAENSYGSNIAKFAERAEAVPERVDGMKDVPLIEGATTTQRMIDPTRPRPRQQVVRQQNVRPAIFTENKLGTKNIGAIAYDAKWSSYGQYLQKMIETVQIQFDRVNIESRIAQISGTHVKVVFRMNQEGSISQIVSVDGNGGNQAQNMAITSITRRAPYGPWTEDMIAVLGESQELTFTFYYH
jgi:hypothetical protein